jgi:hypothetical protein
MDDRARVRGLPVFGVAVAGLVLGHVVSYLIAVPDPHQRAFLLQRTGHAYLPALGEAALILALGGIVALFVRAFAGFRGGGPEGVVRLACALALVQVSAFAGQEVLERLVAGAPLRELVGDHILIVGAIVQIAIAAAGAATLRWLTRAAVRLATSVGSRAALPRVRPVLALPDTALPANARLLVWAGRVRAPPSS